MRRVASDRADRHRSSTSGRTSSPASSTSRYGSPAADRGIDRSAIRSRLAESATQRPGPDPGSARARGTGGLGSSHARCGWSPAGTTSTTWSSIPEVFSAATEPSFLARALGRNMLTLRPARAHPCPNEMMLPPFQPGGRSGAFVARRAGALVPIVCSTRSMGRRRCVELMSAYAQPLSAGSLAIVLGLDHSRARPDVVVVRGPRHRHRQLRGRPGARRGRCGREGRSRRGDQRARIDTGMTPTTRPAIAAFLAAGATREEVVNNVRLMISGGINEPRDGIGLVRGGPPDPARPARAGVDADPAAMRRLVEEVFRVYSPVGTITRQATRDVELGGRHDRGGRPGRGRAPLGQPRRAPLDATRPRSTSTAARARHAAFALGAHRCLGEWLGRQEVRSRCRARARPLARPPTRP